ncbi:hypothetical protein SteCoe_29267 [Stentor coeruleus]|uniref:TNFR-Cys domain-containing protein n=1 Tax=Stentor coeruleus TaxID=5963 RepID=A0A1R2B6C5_9CILI|nr:hypothetical protein SteCoe_29267 [Stentor coeruleus]
MLTLSIFLILSIASSCNTNYCQECSSTICTKCERYKYFDSNNICCTTSNCQDCSHSNICNKCQEGFSLQNSFCCPLNCFSCTLDSYCLICSEGYTPIDGLCMECPENCSTCNRNNFCYTCKEDYEMDLEQNCKSIDKYSNRTYLVPGCIGLSIVFVSSLLLYFVLKKINITKERTPTQIHNDESINNASFQDCSACCQNNDNPENTTFRPDVIASDIQLDIQPEIRPNDQNNRNNLSKSNKGVVLAPIVKEISGMNQDKQKLPSDEDQYLIKKKMYSSQYAGKQNPKFNKNDNDFRKEETIDYDERSSSNRTEKLSSSYKNYEKIPGKEEAKVNNLLASNKIKERDLKNSIKFIPPKFSYDDSINSED